MSGAHKAAAPNRRPRFPLGAVTRYLYPFYAQPTSPAAVGDANPYDPDHTEYFERRRRFAGRTLPRQRIGKSIPAGV